MNEKIKHFSLLTGSTLIMAVGTYFFKFTNNFTFGGITGLAVLVADKTNISASDFSFIVNMLLLALGSSCLDVIRCQDSLLQYPAFRSTVFPLTCMSDGASAD